MQLQGAENVYRAKYAPFIEAKYKNSQSFFKLDYPIVSSFLSQEINSIFIEKISEKKTQNEKRNLIPPFRFPSCRKAALSTQCQSLWAIAEFQ
jgi:hypothetical protein